MTTETRSLLALSTFHGDNRFRRFGRDGNESYGYGLMNCDVTQIEV